MRVDRIVLLLTIHLCLLFFPVLSSADQPPDVSVPPRKVLILSSYHFGYTWSDRELSGIIETLDRSGLKTDLHVEYLDSKNFPKYEHFEQLKALFAVKYSKIRPALVITLDNPAFEFAIKYRQQLFKDTPVVFAGLNDFDSATLKGETGITGVVEKQDIGGTVKLALALQPETKEVLILHDYTASGLASRSEAEEQLAPLASSVKFRYLPDMSIEDISATLRGLKPGTVVLPFSYSRDMSGRVFTHGELTEILSKSSVVPIYGTKEERLGYGIIGGSLLEGKSHGALAAAIAVRILKGENAASIPVITKPESRLVFDYKILKRFKINPDRLPPGSEVINRSPGFYQQHGKVINVAAAIIAILAFSLALVIAANRRRKIAEAALLESERKRSTELEIANSEMESFCYAVSHDLQAPLRHINSFSSIIEEEHLAALDESGRFFFNRIKGASSKMGLLIKDLLMLSQISREEINSNEFDLGELAEEVFSELKLISTVNNLQLEVDRNMSAIADRRLMKIALNNLIGNAIKYSSKTDSPTIHVGKKSDGSETVFFVRDNGIGFDMQYADKLFAPFNRLHSENEFEGTGIGLATVQRVIHRHGGKIWADSRPGEGATFFFTLQP